MNRIGVRQASESWQQARYRAAEAKESLGSLGYWLRRLPGAAWCAVTGWHQWGPWRETTSVFAQPERRYCPRCGGSEYRGETPTFDVRVEAGSMRRA